MNRSVAQRRSLFFALWPDTGTRARIGREAGSIIEGREGRKVPRANLHMTLLYLGPVEVGRQDEIISLVPQLDLPAFTLQIDRVGCWRRSGVIWLAPSSFSEVLFSLVAALKEVGREAGCEFDERPFKPHVTLMRKARRGVAVTSIKPLEWRVEGFSLMVSEPAPHGVTYRQLKVWPLNREV